MKKRLRTEETKKKLTAQQCHVLFEKGTEAPFTGKWIYNKEKGVYTCANCGAELFSSETKYAVLHNSSVASAMPFNYASP